MCPRLFVIFLAILGVFKGYGQDSAPSRYAIVADSNGRAGNVEEAIAGWKQDYALLPDPSVAYTLAQLYALKEEALPAFEWLRLALEKDSSVSALTEGDFIFLPSLPEWETIENQQIEKSESQQGKYKNLALSKRLWRLQMKDQAYTTQWSQARKKLGQEHPVTKALQVLIQKTRTENSIEARQIIERYGWPKIPEVGKPAATSVFYIIQHGAPEWRKKYIVQLKKACAAQNAPWIWYATMYDRILNDEGKKQWYGTQFTQGLVLERKPIESPEYVNKRRRALGLEPLEDFNVPQKD